MNNDNPLTTLIFVLLVVKVFVSAMGWDAP
jgi:hypothetical protein